MVNLKNVIIAITVPLPSIVFYLTFLKSSSQSPPLSTTNDAPHWLPNLWTWCTHHPLLLANLLFFFNIDILFWLIGFVQSSNWMIDLYWTVIPVMLVHFYASHPFARADRARSVAVVVLTWVWSVRLTHNYFRRERWEWGQREDWRFSDMREEYGRHWWWISFFVVYACQQVFLMGICLPMYSVHSSEEPWSICDFVATIVCVVGIVIAYFADTQLYDFTRKNEILKELGMPVEPNLEKGLWRYSRHPNYFGEQLWWWGLFIYGWNVGHGWTFVGPLVNSLCLAYVTVLVERRMLKKESRVDAYRLYQKTTSVWIPWFKSSLKGGKDKKL
ncbi:hypothetical protein QJS10_CPB11g01879 [Acorus calamus]|uniref:Steroid 5-alpha reductase C-terminal domain-containing protein n=1 Tax=Acorus calamus TaxID=4465 RepID=A0AAV9DRX6_ACOCL|nr:hypothetical protein QJS10_CPB11g01879 [Acorus calamus]